MKSALMASSFLVIKVDWITDVVGLGLTGVVALVQWQRRRGRQECRSPLGSLEEGGS